MMDAVSVMKASCMSSRISQRMRRTTVQADGYGQGDFVRSCDCGLALEELSEADTVEDGYGLTVGDH
ncbi:hypothetical protein SAMN05216275_102337 [Streptosporangium canum]|uniref:Uncharacterized protein n=1 Tax=Streptosporangium canum TaxID=324952 RepID=A0A1I3H3G2_9ACTN|nr:hypothetical protein SAMN05216275_102337 [Streptosporangium canum]